MADLTIGGFEFTPYISREAIEEKVKNLGVVLNEAFSEKAPHFIVVLKGAFVFAADLIRECGLNNAGVSFVRYSSYAGTNSTGKVKVLQQMPRDIEGKDVIVIEDIVDTGLTALKLLENIKTAAPRSVTFVTLLLKPDNLKVDFTPDYHLFSIPSEFVVGYGLDLDGMGRSLREIYIKKN